MSTTLAARDPDEWGRPNEIILNRKPRHVSFGYGPHLCVGMHLAKREMRIAMKEFLTVIPEFRLTPGVEMRTALHGVIQPDKLMLEWDMLWLRSSYPTSLSSSGVLMRETDEARKSTSLNSSH